MKTIILFVTTLFLSATITTISAKTPTQKRFINTEITDAGLIKECIVQDDNYNFLLKFVYDYASDNSKKNVVTYKWSEMHGWRAIHKYDYTFNSGQLTHIVYTKWDRKKENWSKKSKIITYKYDSNGKFITMNKEIIDYSKNMTAKQ
jgi:hypothetical protein